MTLQRVTGHYGVLNMKSPLIGIKKKNEVLECEEKYLSFSLLMEHDVKNVLAVLWH